jgi:hypothetical protein
VTDTNTITLITNSKTGLSAPFPHTAGPLLILGDSGCGETVIMKKLLNDVLHAGATIFVFDAVGGSHQYHKLFLPLTTQPGHAATDKSLEPKQAPDLGRPLAANDLTHLFFDPVDWCLDIPEIMKAWSSARSHNRFVAGAASMDDLLYAPEGSPLLEANPSLLLMRTRGTGRRSPDSPLGDLLEHQGLSRTFLRDLEAQEALLVNPDCHPTPVRIDLTPAKLALFDTRPVAKSGPS